MSVPCQTPFRLSLNDVKIIVLSVFFILAITVIFYTQYVI